MIPVIIDGAIAVISAEFGFDACFAFGLCCLLRFVRTLAHVWEQIQRAGG